MTSNKVYLKILEREAKEMVEKEANDVFNIVKNNELLSSFKIV